MCLNIIQLLRLCIEERGEMAAMPISVMIMMTQDEVRLVAAGETSHSFLFFFPFFHGVKSGPGRQRYREPAV